MTDNDIYWECLMMYAQVNILLCKFNACTDFKAHL